MSYRCVGLYCYTGKLDQNNMVRNTHRLEPKELHLLQPNM